MHKVTEMLCMFCLRSVTTTSPVCEQNDTFQENVAITRCRHLMHMSCFVYAHPSDPVTCRHPKCGKIIDCNQVDVVEAILQDRITVKSEEKCNVVEEVTTRLNEATCNLVEELTTRLKVAEDKIAQAEANSNRNAELVMEADKRAASEAKAAELDAKQRYDAAQEKMAQLESNVKHYSELVVDANKRANEAKAAELDANKRYELVVGKLSNQLIACTCIASDSSVLVSKDCTGVPLLLPNELSPPGLTSPIVPISGSNNALQIDQNQQVVRVKKTDTFNMDFLKDKQLTEDDVSREIETIPTERVLAAEEQEKDKTDDHVLQQETGDKVFQEETNDPNASRDVLEELNDPPLQERLLLTLEERKILSTDETIGIVESVIAHGHRLTAVHLKAVFRVKRQASLACSDIYKRLIEKMNAENEVPLDVHVRETRRVATIMEIATNTVNKLNNVILGGDPNPDPEEESQKNKESKQSYHQRFVPGMEWNSKFKWTDHIENSTEIRPPVLLATDTSSAPWALKLINGDGASSYTTTPIFIEGHKFLVEHPSKGTIWNHREGQEKPDNYNFRHSVMTPTPNAKNYVVFIVDDQGLVMRYACPVIGCTHLSKTRKTFSDHMKSKDGVSGLPHFDDKRKRAAPISKVDAKRKKK